MNLKKLSTEFGTGYVFDYEESDDGNSYVTKVADLSGRSIELKYEDIDDKFSRTGKMHVLTEIHDEMGSVYSFKYNDLCKMYTVINARNTVNLINEYDGSGRVTRQIFPDGGEITVQYYDIGRRAIATHQNGSQTVYEHDEKFRAPYPDIQVGTKSLHTMIPMIEPRTAIRTATLHRMNTMTKVM